LVIIEVVTQFESSRPIDETIIRVLDEPTAELHISSIWEANREVAQ
jgi:hypothetical protein